MEEVDFSELNGGDRVKIAYIKNRDRYIVGIFNSLGDEDDRSSFYMREIIYKHNIPNTYRVWEVSGKEVFLLDDAEYIGYKL